MPIPTKAMLLNSMENERSIKALSLAYGHRPVEDIAVQSLYIGFSIIEESLSNLLANPDLIDSCRETHRQEGSNFDDSFSIHACC